MITGRVTAVLDVRITEKEGERFIDMTPWQNGYGNGTATFNKKQALSLAKKLEELAEQL